MPSLALSPFQKEKLKYYFNFYEPNEEGFLDKSSVDNFMRRVLTFTKWDPNGNKATSCREIHEAFFEILSEKAEDTGGNKGMVSLEEWYDMWASILPGCMGIQNFPVWLRLLPKTLFQMIDRNNDLTVGPTELVAFYRDMVHIPEDVAESRALYAYDQMTDAGRWPLNLNSYEMIFSNFLIGRTPFGPGRHIFGCFEHNVTGFSLILPAADDGDDDGGDQQMEEEGGQRHIPPSHPRPKREGSRRALV